MKVTIKDIARECGVSVATVSLALSGKPSRIAASTKAQITETAMRMHYQPNQAAVSLATKNSKWIGMIINDLRNTHIASLFMAIDREIQKRGYSLICHVLTELDIKNGYQMLKDLAASNVAGFVWAKPFIYSENTEDFTPKNFIDQIGIPVATMDGYDFNCPGVTVKFDYFEAGYLAVQHLLELGHTRIGCVTGPMDFKVTVDRLNGYKKALKEFGIPYDEALIYEGNYEMRNGFEALSALLGQKATAIFSFNDEMAFGIYQGARQYGIKIPHDLSVIGCDNVPYTDVLEVPLSTVDVPAEEMGSVMARELIAAIEGKTQTKRKAIDYKPKLRLKGSTKKRSEHQKQNRVF